MKKLITLLFAAGLVTAASAQSGDRYRNDSRNYNNNYQSSPYSNYDQNGYSNQYQYNDQYNSHSQWNDGREYNRYERRRHLAEMQRYEMMMRRNRAHYYDRRYSRYPSYGYSTGPVFQLSLGFGGRR